LALPTIQLKRLRRSRKFHGVRVRGVSSWPSFHSTSN